MAESRPQGLRVFQERHEYSTTAPGDCFRAALATVLSSRMEDTPDIVLPECFHGDFDWVDVVRKFAKMCGYSIVHETTSKVPRHGWCIVIAMTTNKKTDDPHAFVFKAGRLYHDPHPLGYKVRKVIEVITFKKRYVRRKKKE